MKHPALAQLRENISCLAMSADMRAENYRLIEQAKRDFEAELDAKEREYVERVNELLKNKSH